MRPSPRPSPRIGRRTPIGREHQADIDIAQAAQNLISPIPLHPDHALELEPIDFLQWYEPIRADVELRVHASLNRSPLRPHAVPLAGRVEERQLAFRRAVILTFPTPLARTAQLDRGTCNPARVVRARRSGFGCRSERERLVRHLRGALGSAGADPDPQRRSAGQSISRPGSRLRPRGPAFPSSPPLPTT